MKNSRNFIKKFNYPSKIYCFIIFLFLFVISACKNSSESSQSLENNITNLNIIEKISISHENKPEQIQDKNLSENLLDAIELKLKLQEKFKNLKIESEEDFLSDEEIALLSPHEILQYIDVLFKNDKLHQEAIYHILKSDIMNSDNTNIIKYIYSMIGYKIYDTEKNKENIKMLYDYAKNIGNTELLNILYERILNTIKYNRNIYIARALCIQLSELYQDDPEKKQEIEFHFCKKNEDDTPYEEIEKNFDNFLKNADQNYKSYNEALELFSQQKTIAQILKTINDSRFQHFKYFVLNEKHLEDLKNQKEKDNRTLKEIEYLEKYHSLYSNIYQQTKEIYQK